MNGKKLERTATTLRDQGKGLEAVGVYQQAKKAYIEDGDLTRAAGMQHMTGVSYKIENDLEHALNALNEASRDYEAAGDLLGPGRVQRDIGIMYEYYDQLDLANEHLLKSKESLEAAPKDAKTANGEKRNAELGITLAKLGLVALRLSHLDQAEQYMMDGLVMIRGAGHPFYEMTTLMHLGSLYFATGHYGRMLANLEAALGLIYEYNMQEEQTRRLAQIWGLMAHGYLNLENMETARYFAEKSFTVIHNLSESAAGPVKKDIQAEALQHQLGI